MNPNSTRWWMTTTLALALPAALLAQGSSDRIQRLRERLLERGRDRTEDPAEVPASKMVLPDPGASGGPGAPGAGAAGDLTLDPPAATVAPKATPPSEPDSPEDAAEGVASEDLNEKERYHMTSAASRVVDDAELLAKGGFEVLSADDEVSLIYPEKPGDAEYILEVQSLLKVPGAKVPVPHQRLMVVKANRTVRSGGRLGWTFHVEQARESQLQENDGKPQLVLATDEGTEGAVIPLDTDLQGVPSRADQMANQSRYVEWLRLLLPARPKQPGYGWRTLSPRSMGSRREVLGGVYLFHRLVKLGGDRKVAVIRGRFQGRGAEMGESKFLSRGQDRVLFDLDSGRVLYREFRMEGTYLRVTPQGPQPYQARIKGLVMERSLLEGLSAEDRKARLNAATALFGQ